jgi:hypothetical protein
MRLIHCNYIVVVDVYVQQILCLEHCQVWLYDVVVVVVAVAAFLFVAFLLDAYTSISLVDASLVDVFTSTSLVDVFTSTSLVDAFTSTSLVDDFTSTSLVDAFTSTSLVDASASYIRVVRREHLRTPRIRLRIDIQNATRYLNISRYFGQQIGRFT